MSRSFFSSRPRSRDSNSNKSPLLPQHSASSYSLHDISPRPSDEISRAASPSPPPAFYRAARLNENQNSSRSPEPARYQDHSLGRASPSLSLSSSPSRTKTRKIQFAAPPPPIATSVLLQTPARADDAARRRDGRRSPQLQLRRGNSAVDPLLSLERREKAIQSELQLLLDAQSAGLVQGFGGAGSAVEESSDAGSSTPTSRSFNMRSESNGTGRVGGSGGGVVPVRQPRRKPLSLRGARRGLLRDMAELGEIKSEEVGILDEEIRARDRVLEQVSAWEKKIQGAREQLSGYDGADGETDGELAELKTEERAVDIEIREMEDRLAQMKARKRWLGEQIRESVNKKEARLSSYRGALREAEGQVKEFLKRPPVPVSVVMGSEEGIYALPHSRRTLEMAREWWQKEERSLKDKREEMEKEKLALEEGALMWQSAVEVVSGFENELKSQMKSGTAPDKDLFKGQVEKMGTVIEKLKDMLGKAEKRGWNLLICAIGAELQAFKEGEGLLKSALAQQNELLEPNKDEDLDQSLGGVGVGATTNGLDELASDPDGSHQLKGLERTDTHESEDDGPNLDELLIDRSNADVD